MRKRYPLVAFDPTELSEKQIAELDADSKALKFEQDEDEDEDGDWEEENYQDAVFH